METLCTHRVYISALVLSSKFGRFTHNTRVHKEVVILRSDNGPNEAPINPSTRAEMAQLFIKFDLVLLLLASLPSGCSLFNPCERRMAPLSRMLTGVLLDHKHFGSHLNSEKQTVDDNMERKITNTRVNVWPTYLKIYMINITLLLATLILQRKEDFKINEALANVLM